MKHKNCYNLFTMKTSTPISSQLGLTQSQLAEILGVSRSLISLFELGRRSLPAKALSQLGLMLEHVQAAPLEKKGVNVDVANAVVRIIDRMLLENEFKRELLYRKMAAMDRKLDQAQRFTSLSSLFESSSLGPKLSPKRLAKAQDTKTDCNHIQMQIKMELLEVECKFLTEKKNDLNR